MKRLVLLISFFVILFGIFLFIYLMPRDYMKEYKIDEFIIKEKYIKKSKAYYYQFKYQEQEFEYISKTKYINKRKLIKSINFWEIKEGYCFIPESDYHFIKPMCLYNEEIIDYHLIDEIIDKIDSKYYTNIDKLNKKYKDIEINYLNNKKFLIWNYNSFYYLDNDLTKEIKVFDTDYYNISLATKINNYLFIPKYDDSYNFSEVYILNVDNLKISNWDLEKDIYFESRILGTYNKSIYLLDEKNESLYEIVPHKKKMRKVKGQILIGNDLVKTNIKDIINKKMEFKPFRLFDYDIINDKLYKIYDNSKVLLSTKKISRIIDVIDYNVYYISGDSLYVYNELLGEVKLLTNFEWTFNNDNVIFIY